MAPVIDPESFSFLIIDLARLMRGEIDRRIASAGLGITAGEARVLAYAQHLGPVRQAILAERAMLEPMTVSTYLDRLQTRGLVDRRPDPADRRVKMVHLTPAADAVLQRVADIVGDIRAITEAGMDPAGSNRLRGDLARLRHTLLLTAGLRQ